MNTAITIILILSFFSSAYFEVTDEPTNDDSVRGLHPPIVSETKTSHLPQGSQLSAVSSDSRNTKPPTSKPPEAKSRSFTATAEKSSVSINQNSQTSLMPESVASTQQKSGTSTNRKSGDTTHHNSRAEVGELTTLKLLPEYGDSFRCIREKEKLFVDKTQYIKKLVDNEAKLFILTRPRRFGKTVFLQMLHDFLSGEEEYFKGTSIHSRGNLVKPSKEGEKSQWERFPIIYMSFTELSLLSAEEMKKGLCDRLKQIAKHHKLTSEITYDSVALLIDDLWLQYQKPVSVLIDDYDYPLTQGVYVGEELRTVTRILTQFYEQIRQQVDKLRFALVLGVSKLHILGNGGQLRYKDLTFDDEFSQAIGFTSDELEDENFKSYMVKFPKYKSHKLVQAQIKTYYGKYRFAVKEDKHALNPSSICACLNEQEFENFMVDLDIPVEIAERMAKENVNLEYFEDYAMPKTDLTLSYHHYTEKNIPLPIFMVCNGYLTIKGYNKNKNMLYLTYPNDEVRKTLKQLLQIAESELTTIRTLSSVEEYLEENKMASFVELVNEYAFREKSELMQKNLSIDEVFVTSQIQTALRAQKVECQVNVNLVRDAHKDAGDIDVYIRMRNPNKMNYIIEIKYNKDHAVEAILQLMEYVIDDIVPLRNAIDRETDFYLVGMNVRIRDNKPEQNQEIMDWICIPYRKNKIIVNQMTASDPSFSGSYLKEEFNEKFPKYKSKADKVIYWQ